jgi:hypothetical protein
MSPKATTPGLRDLLRHKGVVDGDGRETAGNRDRIAYGGQK